MPKNVDFRRYVFLVGIMDIMLVVIYIKDREPISCMVYTVLLTFTLLTHYYNRETGRFGRGKVARKMGEYVYTSIFLPRLLFSCVVAGTINAFAPYNESTRWWVLVGLLSIFTALVLDDFFNGGPRKKRFRKWLKNKLAKLVPVWHPTPQPN